MAKNTKYAFTAYTQKLDNGVELRKIVALKDFRDVKKRRRRWLVRVRGQPKF